MSAKRNPLPRIVLSVMLLCWIRGALVCYFSPGERTLGIVGCVTCLVLGLLFLTLSLPLGKFMNRMTKDAPIPEPGGVPWPRSSPGWSVRLILAAILLFAMSLYFFYWGTPPAAKPAFIRSLDNFFH